MTQSPSAMLCASTALNASPALFAVVEIVDVVNTLSGVPWRSVN
ncbi:MAG: hypothetical protein ABWY12_16085 [Burkholderiales bacterium]